MDLCMPFVYSSQSTTRRKQLYSQSSYQAEASKEPLYDEHLESAHPSRYSVKERKEKYNKACAWYLVVLLTFLSPFACSSQIRMKAELVAAARRTAAGPAKLIRVTAASPPLPASDHFTSKLQARFIQYMSSEDLILSNLEGKFAAAACQSNSRHLKMGSIMGALCKSRCLDFYDIVSRGLWQAHSTLKSCAGVRPYGGAGFLMGGMASSPSGRRQQRCYEINLYAGTVGLINYTRSMPPHQLFDGMLNNNNNLFAPNRRGSCGRRSVLIN